MNTNQKSMRYDQNDYDALLHSKIPAALVETPQMNFDDASDASVFFARELDYVKSQSYDVEYPEFTALKLFPVSSEINPGAETVTYYSYDKTGMAKIISNYATDLPRADVKGKPTTAIIKSLGDSYGYSIQEMRASAMAGKSLDARKAESARYQIDYLNNKIAWNGDAETRSARRSVQGQRCAAVRPCDRRKGFYQVGRQDRGRDSGRHHRYAEAGRPHH